MPGKIRRRRDRGVEARRNIVTEHLGRFLWRHALAGRLVEDPACQPAMLHLFRLAEFVQKITKLAKPLE